MNKNHDNFSVPKPKIPPETYNSSGVNINELPKKDKDEVISILKVEFLPN